MKTGIIFDLDGTLLDTIDDIAAACNRGLEEFDFPPRTVEEYRRAVGSGIEELVRRVLPPDFINEGLFPQILSAVRRQYAAVVVDKTVPYPGITTLLDELSLRAVPMAVVSNKPHDLTVASVNRLLGNYRFAGVFGDRPDRPRKPDPAVCLDLAALMDRLPADMFLVGDSEVDVATAKNAGMKAVACTWGFRGKEELEALRPYAVIDRPEELLGLVGLP